MAFVLNRQFDESTEQKMGAFVQTLSEKDRRRYAAMEAVRLGHGGIAYIADVLGCSDRTIENGINELEMAYQTDRHATQEFRQNMKFKLDNVLPRWNYTVQVQLD